MNSFVVISRKRHEKSLLLLSLSDCQTFDSYSILSNQAIPEMQIRYSIQSILPANDSIEKSDLLMGKIQGVFIASIVAMPHEKSSCKSL
jgi:hypothetical protein